MSQRALPAPAVAIGLFSFATFVALGAAIQTGDTTQFDSLVRDRVHDLASPVLTLAMSMVAVFGSPIVLGSVTILLFVFFRLAGCRASASRLAWTMIGAAILENALKFAFQRTRPEPFFGITPPETFSLPSGHALFSACFYCFVASEISPRDGNGFMRAGIITSTVSMIATIGLSRVYLGVHFPTDVIAGYLVAAFWLAVVQQLPRRFLGGRAYKS